MEVVLLHFQLGYTGGNCYPVEVVGQHISALGGLLGNCCRSIDRPGQVPGGPTSGNPQYPLEDVRQLRPPGMQQQCHPLLWSWPTLLSPVRQHRGRHPRNEISLVISPLICRLGSATSWLMEWVQQNKPHHHALACVPHLSDGRPICIQHIPPL